MTRQATNLLPAAGSFGPFTVWKRALLILVGSIPSVQSPSRPRSSFADQIQVLDDDTITCPELKYSADVSTVRSEFLWHCVEYAKIASAITRKLKPSNLPKLSSDELEHTIRTLTEQVAVWRASLPDFARSGKRYSRVDLPVEWNIQHAEYLRCAGPALLFGIHSLLAHPWTVATLCSCVRRNLQDQIQESSRMITETSREVIMASNSMDITASTSNW